MHRAPLLEGSLLLGHDAMLTHVYTCIACDASMCDESAAHLDACSQADVRIGHTPPMRHTEFVVKRLSRETGMIYKSAPEAMPPLTETA